MARTKTTVALRLQQQGPGHKVVIISASSAPVRNPSLLNCGIHSHPLSSCQELANGMLIIQSQPIRNKMSEFNYYLGNNVQSILMEQLTDRTHLKECQGNYLTKITYPLNAEELTYLNIENNNFPAHVMLLNNKMFNGTVGVIARLMDDDLREEIEEGETI
ncbi:16541_t:CDS:2 [Entrophospora sp. SA101]|nr:16541_t:CDS:2 [Entrophospora sp. SA101]